MRTVTWFDTREHHIHTEVLVTDPSGTPRLLNAVIDTGAPWTELSDTFLEYAGFFKMPDLNVAIKPELQTQKYAKLILPSVIICGHTIDAFEVMVSRFDPAWGIGALVGLDFFRRFRVTIDYGDGVLVCDPLQPANVC